MEFSETCTICPRLSNFLIEVKQEHPDYHCKPVSPFGVDNPEDMFVEVLVHARELISINV